MDERVSQFLNDVLKHGEYTAKKLARAADCHPSHIRKVAKGETMLSLGKAIRLSRWLAKGGDTRFAEIFSTEEYIITRRGKGTADGTIQDDITEIDLHKGYFIEAFRKGNHKKAAYHLRMMAEEHEDLWAELDRQVAKAHVNRMAENV